MQVMSHAKFFYGIISCVAHLYTYFAAQQFSLCILSCKLLYGWFYKKFSNGLQYKSAMQRSTTGVDEACKTKIELILFVIVSFNHAW